MRAVTCGGLCRFRVPAPRCEQHCMKPQCNANPEGRGIARGGQDAMSRFNAATDNAIPMLNVKSDKLLFVHGRVLTRRWCGWLRVPIEE